MNEKRQFATEEARSIGTQFKIDWAHLKEIGDYYTRLHQMEIEAESQV